MIRTIKNFDEMDIYNVKNVLWNALVYHCDQMGIDTQEDTEELRTLADEIGMKVEDIIEFLA